MSYKTSISSDEIALIRLSKEGNSEEIFIKGPLKYELLAQLKHRDGKLVKIHYRYAMRNNERTIESGQEYYWNYIMGSGKCSARCNGGAEEISAVSAFDLNFNKFFFH